MIEFDNTDIANESYVLAQKIPASIVLGRISSEIESIKLIVEKIETLFLNQETNGRDKEEITILQSFDSLQQTIDDVVVLVENLSKQKLPSDIDTGSLVKELKLAEIRNRICGKL